MRDSHHLVLVVDDDRDTANVIAELLEEGGYPSCTANTALDSLRLYEAVRPRLVITDETLVDSTGSDLVLTLRRKYGSSVGRALFLTGFPEKVSGLPGDVILEKPVDFSTLIAAVRTMLEEPPATLEAK